MYKRILVATDFSISSDRAVESAVSLASDLGAHLDVLHVFCEPAMPSFYGAGSLLLYGKVPDLKEEAEEILGRLEEKIKEKHSDISIHLIEDKPVKGILKGIEKLQPDLLVIGSLGLTGIKKVLLGSVANEVVREAGCSTLIVKADNGAAS